MRRFAWLVPWVFALLLPAASRAEVGAALGAAPPLDTEGRGWIERNVNLTVRVLPAERKIVVHGTATLILQNAAASELTLWVNYARFSPRPVMTFVTLTGPEGSSSALNQTDAARAGAFYATLHLGKTVAKGSRVNIAFDVESLRGNAFTFTIDNPVSVVDDANGWYPRALDNDGTLDADRQPNVGSTTFILPPGFHSVSIGRLVQAKTSNGATIETWRLDAPSERSFAVGPYSVKVRQIGPTRIETYTLPGTNPARRLTDLDYVLQVLQREYGPFPYRRYALAEVPDREVNWYGLAARELTVERSSIFARVNALGYLAHEAGHAWWGNLVGHTGPGGYMMNEGLAQFSSATVTESVRGHKAYLDGLNVSTDGSLYSAQGYFTHYFGKPADRPLSKLDGSQVSYDLSIAKGTWVYHMLREQVGEKTFFAVLRGLIQRFRGQDVSLADLRAAFIASATRPRDLALFFNQWLDHAGAPVFDWSKRSPGSIEIRQLQRGNTYQLALPIAVHCGTTTFVQTAALTRRTQEVRLTRRCTPTAVDIDPRDTILMWRSLYGPTPPSL